MGGGGAPPFANHTVGNDTLLIPATSPLKGDDSVASTFNWGSVNILEKPRLP